MPTTVFVHSFHDLPAASVRIYPVTLLAVVDARTDRPAGDEEWEATLDD